MKYTRALRSPSGLRVPRSSSGSAGAAALCLIAASAMACGNKATPTPDKEPIAPSAAIVAPTASARAVEAPAIPTLAMEKFAPGGVELDGLYAVEGALMVVDEYRVGRIVDESIEWLAPKVPSDNAALGPNRIDSVYGRWPDSIGVVYSSTNGRAPQPTYMPLKGVGVEHTAAPGGGWGEIHGVARLGESFVLAATQHGGSEIVTVRGTAARKLQTPEQAGCKQGEVRGSYGPSEAPALTPEVIESTPEGSLVSIGLLCGERGRPSAEVWDKAGKSRIIDLTRWWKKMSYWPKLLKGIGDELWAISDSWAPILHFRNGEFEVVPELDRPNRNLFVSPSGKLHANDGRSIHRYEGGKWIPIGHLAEPSEYGTMAMDDKETIWVGWGGVHRLRPTPTPAAAAPEGCSTPFVYLYEISSKNDKKFTYPSTRKALSSFPEVDAISLVEFQDGYRGRLGITVTSKAQGEALIAHLKETMKEETPRLLCFEPPKDARKIDMNAKK